MISLAVWQVGGWPGWMNKYFNRWTDEREQKKQIDPVFRFNDGKIEIKNRRVDRIYWWLIILMNEQKDEQIDKKLWIDKQRRVDRQTADVHWTYFIGEQMSMWE